MEKEYNGIFMTKEGKNTFKSDCKVILNEGNISLYYTNKNEKKFKEFKAESIFSFEEEKLIKISESKNTVIEIIWAFCGALILFSSITLGLSLIALSFIRAIKKEKKSYILLLNPIKKPVLTLLKTRGIRTAQRQENRKAA